jgi:uncharacterized protein (DUF1800 family)
MRDMALRTRTWISAGSRRGAVVARTLALLALLSGEASAQVAGNISVYPASSSLEVTSTLQFTAYVPISPNTIKWFVNDVQGGNATYGTISATGLYTPPQIIPAANVLVVKVQSTAYPSSVGTASLTITRPYPWIWSSSPASVPVGNYVLRFNGSNFASDSQVLANGVAVAATYVSPTSMTVTGSATQTGTLNFSVRQPAPGAVTGNTLAVNVTSAPLSVSVAPKTATVLAGDSQTFSATVTGTANTAVMWSVNGTQGGSTVVGTISSAGVYTAPAAVPSPSSVTVRATSVASPSTSGQATVTVTVPVTISVSPVSASVPLGGTKTFAATVTGSANTAVTWSVNGTAGGSAVVGTINAAGVYTAPAALPSSSTVTIRATSVVNPSASAQATVSLTTAPPPPPAWLSGARFLEQSSFGPTPATLARAQQMGIPAYLDEQFQLPETSIFTPGDNSMGALQQWVLYNYATAPDQLRQRVAYALSQIMVTSANKLIYADEILPWLRLLSQHAFGNYRNLLRDVTMSPSMGKYLDLANSMKPGLAGGANENYPRELMQLFTIGLWKLNQDGSQMLVNGSPVPAYDQQTVQQVALALTGWTYATAPGNTPSNNNWEYFGAPMETRQGNHDISTKNFLGCTLPGGQSVQQDLDGLLDCLMSHPNTAPFVATRLIRSLVTSNPSPAYIKRVADVFAGVGGGVPGDLAAVVRAILTDSEARQDTATANQGRLKEPILQISGLLRALNGGFSSTQGLTYLFDYMSQSVLDPPSVFSWFSPLYHVPNSPLFGPEFQIYSPTEATLRGNFFYSILYGTGGDTIIDLSPLQAYGNDMPGLVEAVNQILLYGRMPDAMKQALIAAAAPGYDAQTRIVTVVYLTALSGQYAIQY